MPRTPTKKTPKAARVAAKPAASSAVAADTPAAEGPAACSLPNDMTADGKPLTSLDSLTQAAECLRTLAHPHRLRIVQMLLNGRYMVGELAEACGIASHMASEHLRLMQRCGFLSASRKGRCTYYTIAEPHLANIMGCIEQRFGSPDHAA